MGSMGPPWQTPPVAPGCIMPTGDALSESAKLSWLSWLSSNSKFMLGLGGQWTHWQVAASQGRAPGLRDAAASLAIGPGLGL
jgi:hypothetical protein